MEIDTDILVRACGTKAAAIAAVDACLAALPRPGQTAAQEADERAKAEALKVRLEALP